MEHDIFEEPIEIKEDSLKKILELVALQKKIQEDIQILEKALNDANRDLIEVSRNQIPAIMQGFNLSELKLSSGEKITVEDKLKASITKDNLEVAYTEMSKDGSEILFKKGIKIENAPNEEEILQILLDNNIPYNMEKSIHPQTLNKFCRERMEKGLLIPNGISVYTYQETKIK